MCEQVAPKDVCLFLHELYTQFDQLCDKHHVYKVEVGAQGGGGRLLARSQSRPVLRDGAWLFGASARASLLLTQTPKLSTGPARADKHTS